MEQAQGSNRRRWLVSAALVASGLVGGAVLAGTGIAGAQSPSSSATAPTDPSTGTAPDPTKAHRAGEELLTGSNAEKATAAALKAVPGGTIERVETDADGDVYEAHMVNADGQRVTVKFDKDFNVTRIEEGHGKR